METTTTETTLDDDDDDALFGGGGGGGGGGSSSHLMRFAACNRLVVLEKIVPLHRGCGVFTGSDRTERFAVGSGDVFSNRRGCYPAAVRSQRRCDGSAESIAGGISVPFRRLVDASSGVGRKEVVSFTVAGVEGMSSEERCDDCGIEAYIYRSRIVFVENRRR